MIALSVLLSLGFHACAAAAANIPSSEFAALRDLYLATGGNASWTHTRGWNTLDGDGVPSDPCGTPTWYGVSCESDIVTVDGSGTTQQQEACPHVVGIELCEWDLDTGNGLQGTIPESIANLTRLKVHQFRIFNVLNQHSAHPLIIIIPVHHTDILVRTRLGDELGK